MAKFILDTSFLSELEKRQQRGLFAAGQFYLARMAEVLRNVPARHGQAYWKLDGGTRIALKTGDRPPRKREGGHLVPRSMMRIHIASREGEPPALLTGELRKRRAWAIGKDAGGFVARFGSNVPYAAALEAKEDMNRPAWQPTMDKHFKTLLRLYCEQIKAGGK